MGSHGAAIRQWHWQPREKTLMIRRLTSHSNPKANECLIYCNLASLQYLHFHLIIFCLFSPWFDLTIRFCDLTLLSSPFSFALSLSFAFWYYFLNYISILSVIFLLHLITVATETIFCSCFICSPFSPFVLLIVLTHFHYALILFLWGHDPLRCFSV